jgi:DNA end-binding protein Ku
MASIWTGAIAFGLVNIPVRVETAVRSHDLGFKLLAPKGKGEFCPVKYERVCKDDGKEVPWDDIVKGFEYEKERFVVLTDEDFDKAALATNKTFEVQDFAPEGDVDPRYFEKPYYLIPQKGGERAYALLRDAMKNTSTLGIGTITLRKKQYLASIKPIGDAIVLDLMRFADEVLDGSEYRFPGADYRPQELQMAEQLIGNLTEEFEPEKYKDEYRENLEKIIAAKMKGKRVTLREAAEPEMTGVIDLMDRLKESLEGKPKKSSGGAKTSRTKKKKSSSSSSSKRKSA